jgi:carboxypeptidase C (cathepsin A)
MNQKKIPSLFFLLLFCSIASMAQVKKESAPAKADIQQDSSNTNITRPQKSITQGSVTVEGKRINYNAIAGTLILKNKDGKPTCSMFYTAYFKADESDVSKRPVMFIYNGGPGSSTVWLHFSGLGPQRVFLKDTARFLPPYKTVNNDYSLLDASDLVFIDMPGTGFSRILTKEKGGAGDPKIFYSVSGDGHAFADFIQEFLSTYNRWNSPKYLYGESYGTFRSAVVSDILENEDNIDLNGVILQSMLFSFNKSQMSQAHAGDILSYVLALPSEAAAAWVNHKLPNPPAEMVPFLDEVKHFAITDYSLALLQGSLLDTNTFNRIANKLHDYTGLPVSYIRKANLKIGLLRFEKELLADEGKITGAYDASFTGPEANPLSEYPSFEPTTSTVSSALVSTFNNYMSQDLKFGKGMEYRFSNNAIFSQFDFRASYNGPNWQNKFYVNVMGDMAGAMTYNPNLKVMVNMGYYDLVTPYFEGEYEMQHLDIPSSLQKNISYAYYNSGHMIYLHIPELKKLHDNVAKFIESTH